MKPHPPTRYEILNQLKNNTFDVLVIGGGATGSGIALDAASRGLKTALIEGGDFSCGTSSASSKLIHGGVRYLEQAFKFFNLSYALLVKDAMQERATLLRLAPHLTHTLPIMIPCYSLVQSMYYMIGLKIYEWIASVRSIGKGHWLSREETLLRFPYLRKEKLKGSVVYYDGQFEDAGFNLALIQTAIEQGAAAANYIIAKEFIKEEGMITGVIVQNALSDEEFTIKAKHVINATGPFCDRIRKIDDPDAKPILRLSRGSHITLSPQITAKGYGLLIPRTKDGRILFILPWSGKTLVGTTDVEVKIPDNPSPSQEEIAFLQKEMKRVLQHDFPIEAKWSGIRPLIARSKSGTKSLSRDHQIFVSASGLLSITGGKWTTYRKMAEDAVNTICNLPCKTEQLALFEDLQKIDFSFDERVRYAVRNEWALTAEDVLFRRLRTAFQSEEECLEKLETVIWIMGDELSWSCAYKEKERQKIKAKIASRKS